MQLLYCYLQLSLSTEYSRPISIFFNYNLNATTEEKSIIQFIIEISKFKKNLPHKFYSLIDCLLNFIHFTNNLFTNNQNIIINIIILNQIQMWLIPAIILATSLGLLIGPLLLRYLLLLFKVFHHFEFTMIHPFSVGNLSIRKNLKLSFIRSILMLIHRINLKRKGWKLLLKIQRLQIFLQVNNLSFQKINQLKANYEAKTLNNICIILPEVVEYFLTLLYNQRFKKQTQTVESTRKQSGPFGKSISGLITIGIMLITQFMQLQIDNIEIDFTQDISQKVQFLKLKALSIINLRTPLISTQFRLTKDYQLQFKLVIPTLIMEQFSEKGKQMYRIILEINEINFSFCLPFNLNFQKAIQHSEIGLKIQLLQLKIQPSDLEHICDLIGGISFMGSLKQFCNTKASPKIQKLKVDVEKQSASFSSFIVEICAININIQQIYQKDSDTNQSSQYLTAVKDTSLKATNLKVNIQEHGNVRFTVDQISLLLEMVQSTIKMLSITSFLFEHEVKGPFNSFKNIRHDNVVVQTNPQSLAVLTKIFILISRIRRQHYELLNYIQFLNYYLDYQKSLLVYVPDGYFQFYLIGLKDKIQEDLKPARLFRIYKRSLTRPVIMNNKQQLPTQNIEDKVTYSVGQVSFNLTLKQITHRLDFVGAVYQRIMQRSRVLNVVKVDKLSVMMPASGKKQFQLMKIQLYVKEGKLLTEVDMFIDEFCAMQDELSLIQYLVGFPVIQRAMQIKSNEKKSSGGGRSRQTYSIKKTVFSYQKIFLNLQQFTFQVGKKTLDSGQLNMSVNKIEITYKFDMRIAEQRFMFINKKTIRKDVEMIKILNITLASAQNKHLIVVKNPQIILPKQFIGMGKQYQKLQTTINNLSTYLEAYLLNISDQILREIKKNIQQRIQHAESIQIKCYKLNMQVQDSEWNSFILNYSRLVRQYLSQQLFYNQQEIINEINRGKVKKPLLEIGIAEIKMQLGPIKDLTSQKAIVSYIDALGEHNYNSNDVLFYHHQFINASISKLLINLRDYPFDIVDLTSLALQTEIVHVNMKPSYEIDNCVYYYFKIATQVGELKLTAGLNISSAIRQLVYRMNKLIQGYKKAPQKTAQQMIWLQEIKKLKAKKKNKVQANTNFVPYWEIFRQRAFFKLTLEKNKQTIIQLLTDIRPYSLESIVTKLGKLYIIGDKQQIMVTFHGLRIEKQVEQENFQMVHFGKINCKTILSWKPLLNIQFQIAMGEQYHNMVHLRTDLIQFLINLPQLRTDILLLYGINIPKASTQLGDISGKTVELSLIKWMTYGELVQFAFDKTLQNKQNTLSVWNIIQRVLFVFSLRQLSVVLSVVHDPNAQDTEVQGIQLVLGHSRLRLLCIPQVRASKAQWIIKDGSGKIDTTVGRIYYDKLLTLAQIQQFYMNRDLSTSRTNRYNKDLFQTLVIAQTKMKNNFKQYPKQYKKAQSRKRQTPKNKQQFFLQSNSLIFIKNHFYRGQNDDQFIAQNFIEYDGLKLVLSGTLTNILAKLSMIKYKKQIVVINRDQSTIKKKQIGDRRGSLFKDVEEELTRKQQLMQRFRNAVRLIIGHKRQGGIKSLFNQIRLNVLFVLRKPQINIFYQEKHSQIVLRTPKSCQIQFRVNHLPYDTLELDPKFSLRFKFKQFQLWSCTQFNTVKWLQNDLRNQNDMQLCLQCPLAIFKMSLFKLQKCSIDFSLRILNKQQQQGNTLLDKTRMWGSQQRKKYIQIDLSQVNIELDGTQKLALINIIQFFILMTSSKKKRFIQQTKIYQAKMNEIKIYGKTKILQRLVNKANKDIIDPSAKEEMIMKFNLKKISLRLVNRDQLKHLISKCFMVVDAEEISFEIAEKSNNCIVVSMEAKEIEVTNPLEENKSKYRTILAMNHLGKTALKFYLETYIEKVFDKNNTWNFHRIFSLSVNPIKVKFTDQLYKELMQFVQFGIQDIKYIPETMIQKNSLQRFHQPEEIEEYYNKILIQPIKVQLWYDSSNLLKRMDGISIQLDKFIKGSKFCLKKDIFNSWTKFVLKQIVKQAFSVLGQKMFGGQQEQNSDQEEIIV